VDIEDVNHTGDATLLHKVNESAVLEPIRENGPMTRAEIVHRLPLGLPTITPIVTDPIEDGWVCEHNAANSRGDRRLTLLEFNFLTNVTNVVYIYHKTVAAVAIVMRETSDSLFVQPSRA
jgi:hypothetical protein